MPLITSIVRLVLTAIFSLAAVTKLTDQRGTREAVVNFGAPKSAAPAIAILLPIAEFAIAIGLLFAGTSYWSAWAALMLLLLFILAISINLSRGETHDCHCFGQLYSRPLGWPTLVRNVLFAIGAAFIIWQHLLGFDPPILPTLTEAVNSAGTAQLVLIGVATLAFVIGFMYWRRRATKRAVEEAEGLAIGSPAPHFELESYEGGTQTLPQLLKPGKPLLLIFTNPHCGPCIVLFEEISEWQKAHGQMLTIALITRGTIKDNFVNVARNQLGQVLLQGEQNISAEYRARATPNAVVVDQQGRIASKVVGGAEDIRALLEQVLVSSNGSLKSGEN